MYVSVQQLHYKTVKQYYSCGRILVVFADVKNVYPIITVTSLEGNQDKCAYVYSQVCPQQLPLWDLQRKITQMSIY